MKYPRIDIQSITQQWNSRLQDLAGEYNLLIFGSADCQQQQTETWLPFAGRLEDAFPAFHYYEISVVDRPNFLDQFFSDQGTPAANPKFNHSTLEVNLNGDKLQVNQQLGIGSEQEITLLLVRQDGAILWRTSGIWTAAKAESLDEMLLTLTPLAEDPDDMLFESFHSGTTSEYLGTRETMPVYA